MRIWARSTPDEAQCRLSALLARRAAAELKAAIGGGTIYLENGNRIV